MLVLLFTGGFVATERLVFLNMFDIFYVSSRRGCFPYPQKDEFCWVNFSRGPALFNTVGASIR